MRVCVCGGEGVWACVMVCVCVCVFDLSLFPLCVQQEDHRVLISANTTFGIYMFRSARGSVGVGVGGGGDSV